MNDPTRKLCPLRGQTKHWSRLNLMRASFLTNTKWLRQVEQLSWVSLDHRRQDHKKERLGPPSARHGPYAFGFGNQSETPATTAAVTWPSLNVATADDVPSSVVINSLTLVFCLESMSKDQPIKNFGLEGHHGFKKFDVDKRNTMSYPDSSADARPTGSSASDLRMSHQQQDSAPSMRGPGGLMQHQRHRHLSNPQQRAPSLGAQLGEQSRQVPLGPMGQQRVYGDPGDYIRLASGQSIPGVSGLTTTPSILGLESSLGSSYNYEDLDLSDPEATNALLMRPDLMVTADSLIHQREQDLNLASSTPPSMAPSSSAMPMPGFVVPNRSLLAARSSLLSSHDPLSMLFDQPPLPPAGGYHTGIDNTSSTFSSSSGGLLSHTSSASSSFSMGPGSSSSLNSSSNMPPSSTPLNGNGRNGGNSNGAGRRLHQQQNIPAPNPLDSRNTFLVKQEADEGQFVDDDDTLSRSPINSPSKSEHGHDTHMFASPSGADDRKRGVKRSISSRSASSTNGGQESSACKSPSSSQAAGKNGGVASSSTGDPVTPGPSGESSKTAPNGLDNPKEHDPVYLEKRRKNNESAKRSREARRTKEELVAFKVINLEEENMKLRAEIRLLDKELDELRTRLYQCN
ncbi:thyrotroph embryonic factor [Plakobranchus ocellatus]|uniref:Thyrotroph embryonic factor n=1 Tax=Plakobranchus ocellatus TaxID=259542 RepID=A0AAV3YPP4_9GAST|nr:thyrotroph embryonic factor [Plakobranchus ocellatus]